MARCRLHALCVLLLLPSPALACEWLGGFRVAGPLPSVAPDARPEAPVGTPAPCGPIALDARHGTWLAHTEVELQGPAALQLAAQGAVQVFWDGRLLGGIDDLRPLGTVQEAFTVVGTGRHALQVELRPPADTRVHFGLRLVPLTGPGPWAAPRGALALPPAAALPPPAPVAPPPPRSALPRTPRPPMPGVDREYLYDFHEFHVTQGWHRRRFALRIQTPAGLAASRHLPHTGPRDRAVGDVVEGEVITHDAPRWPEGHFAPELPTWEWQVELITDRTTPVFARTAGTTPVQVHDDLPGERRHVWRAVAALPGTTHLRLGAPDPARWRAAFLAHFDAHLRPGLGDPPGQVDEIIRASRRLDLDELSRAAWVTRRLRASGVAAIPLLVRPHALGPPPEDLTRADDFPAAWVSGPDRLDPVGGRPAPDGHLLPLEWRRPLTDLGPSWSPTLGGFCTSPGAVHGRTCRLSATALPPVEIRTKFGLYRRETRPAAECALPGALPPSAGHAIVSHLDRLRPTADALARDRFCRAVARAEAP